MSKVYLEVRYDTAFPIRGRMFIEEDISSDSPPESVYCEVQ
jgi:hypothetical protein